MRAAMEAAREAAAVLPVLRDARRVVVKVGSALVVEERSAAPREAWLASVAADIAAMRARGAEVVLVSSGAIALARRALGLTRRRLRLEEKQAAAAVGQIRLAGAWDAALSAQGLAAAQLLLTLEDSEDRRRYLNARATLGTLLELGCVPVINENDTVATAEIRFGDNDRLAAAVAEMVAADALVLLVRHRRPLHRRPARDPDAATCRWWSASRTRSWPWAGSRRPATPPGDADQAAGRAHRHRRRLRHGHRARQARPPAARDRGGARCTWFLPQPEGRSSRKRWIAGSLAPLGALTVDAGAARALARGSSLLPPGAAVAGEFERGDPVSLLDPRAGRSRAACPPTTPTAPAASPAAARTRSRPSSAGGAGRDGAPGRHGAAVEAMARNNGRPVPRRCRDACAPERCPAVSPRLA
jgi:glutamate 5-kinase